MATRTTLFFGLFLLFISFLPCLGYFDCHDGPGGNQRCILQPDDDYFHCQDGTCVCRAAKCDGNSDCLDGSDEALAECDTIIPAVIGGIVAGTLICCLIPTLCVCFYCLHKQYRKKKKQENVVEGGDPFDAMMMTEASRSSLPPETMNGIDDKNTEV